MITREEALRLCEIVLAQAKAAGAEDASVSLNSSIESHARFADNRITTSGRAENLDITATVWVERRRGSAAGNDADGSALKRLADEAVQIARVSPVHREYVPTLGTTRVRRGRRFRRGDRRHRSRRPRLRARSGAGGLPHREGDRRRVSRRTRVGCGRGDGQRQPPVLQIQRGQLQPHRAQRGRHGFGILRGRSLRSRAPGRAANRRAGGGQGGAIAAAEEHRTGRLPGRPRAPGGVRPDGFPGRAASMRGPQTKDAAHSRPRTERRASARPCSTSASICTAIRSTRTSRRRRRPTRVFPRHGCRSIRAGRARESPVLAVLGA